MRKYILAKLILTEHVGGQIERGKQRITYIVSLSKWIVEKREITKITKNMESQKDYKIRRTMIAKLLKGQKKNRKKKHQCGISFFLPSDLIRLSTKGFWLL